MQKIMLAIGSQPSSGDSDKFDLLKSKDSNIIKFMSP